MRHVNLPEAFPTQRLSTLSQKRTISPCACFFQGEWHACIPFLPNPPKKRFEFIRWPCLHVTAHSAYSGYWSGYLHIPVKPFQRHIFFNNFSHALMARWRALQDVKCTGIWSGNCWSCKQVCPQLEYLCACKCGRWGRFMPVHSLR